MKYFFDTEFNEAVEPLELISVGVVSEDDRQLYAVHQNYGDYIDYWRCVQGMKLDKNPQDFKHLDSCNEWVKRNVLPILHIDPKEVGFHIIGDDSAIKNCLQAFIGLDPAPEFWAYYGDYDWFLLTRLFKSFDKMPKSWPTICYDLHQYAKHVGVNRELPRKLEPVHNALVDARWTKMAFERVKEMRNLRLPVNKEPLWP